MKTRKNPNRRAFLKTTATGAAGAIALASIGLPNLAYATGNEDYKALVQITLSGGNDSVNTFLDLSDSAYDTYRAVRQNMALSRGDILPVQGGAYGFNAVMPAVQQLFENGDCAVVANIGSLREPCSYDALMAERVRLPRMLNSHIDQKAQWIWGEAHSENKLGWLGRVADQMAAHQAENALPMAIGLGRSQAVQGVRVPCLTTRPRNGRFTISQPFTFMGDRPALNTAKERLLGRRFTNRLQAAYQRLLTDAVTEQQVARSVLADIPQFNTQFPDTNIAQSLKSIAQIIALRNHAGVRASRQVFNAEMGHFDTHSGGIGAHNNKIQTLSEALGAFYSALDEIGMRDKVTTFTGSEFGRTVLPNEDGTDHGWGGHHLVMGGAVRGGAVYGRMPDLDPDGSDVYGNRGVLRPDLSVEQYLAPLALWFGLSGAQVERVFPNLATFGNQRLEFMG